MFATIRSRLLWLVGLSLAPAIAILAFDEYVFRQQALRRLQADALRVVSQASDQLEQHIADARARARLLTRFPQVQAIDRSADRAARRDPEGRTALHHARRRGSAGAGREQRAPFRR